MVIKRNFSLKQLITLLIIALSTTSFLSPLFCSVLLSVFFVFLMVTTKGFLNRNIFFGIKPLLVAFLIGFYGLFVNQIQNSIRDIFFFLMPIMIFILGRWFYNSSVSFSKLYDTFINIGFLLGLVHLSTFFLDPGLITQDLNSINAVSHLAGDFVTIALIFSLFRSKLNSPNSIHFSFFSFIKFIVLFLSFFLSYSRTAWAILFITYVGFLLYYFKFRLKSLILISSVFLLLFLLFFVYRNSGTDEISFLGKLLRSQNELSISDYSEMVDITDNWRGFETYRAIETYLEGNFLQHLIGYGFGGLVKLGITINLAGSDYDNLPVLHNGFAYLLIKSGAAGLLMYLYFFMGLLKLSLKGKTNSKDIHLYKFLLFGFSLSLMFTMFVVMGMVQGNQMPIVFFVGYLYAHIKSLSSQYSETSQIGKLN